MLSDQQNDLLEFKTDLVTVVEALSVLQDFIESIFGAKYQNFVTSNGDQFKGAGDVGNAVSALRRLRWKHSKGSESKDERTFSSSPSDGDRESRKDNGYSSSGGAVLEEERRNSSSSSVSNHMSSPTTTGNGYSVKIEKKDEDEESRGFSVSVGRSEVVSVKCEIDDTDFLEDVDPFGTNLDSYHYEAEGSEIRIENCYPMALPQSHERLSQDNPLVADTPGTHSNLSSSRFIPELIPIQTDPLVEQVRAPAATLLFKEDDESGTSSSDNSDDGEWHPSFSYKTTVPKRPKTDTKRKPTVAKSKISTTTTTTATTPTVVTSAPNRFSLQSLNFNPSLAGSQLTTQPTSRQLSSSKSMGLNAGPIFKCDMCPATYKQEDSLRSHQKYKHNPSRVQCTCHLCGKSMVDKYRLQRHLRLHTGEKPFECQYCGQSFYRKDYHTKHLQRKHGISYTANAGVPPNSKLQMQKKSGAVKTKPPSSSVSSSSSSLSTSSSSTTFKNYLSSNVFETPSPPPLSTTSHRIPALSSQSQGLHRPIITHTTSASPATTLTPSSTSTEIGDKETFEDFNRVNYGESMEDIRSMSGEYGDGCGEYGVMGNLMSMTSLTFDDLISADL